MMAMDDGATLDATEDTNREATATSGTGPGIQHLTPAPIRRPEMPKRPGMPGMPGMPGWPGTPRT